MAASRIAMREFAAGKPLRGKRAPRKKRIGRFGAMCVFFRAAPATAAGRP
jgi:hypothetical protein